MAEKQPWAATNAPTYAERMATQHPRLCKAHRASDGEPCGAFAIRGGSVCAVHGGRAPQVRRKAQQRLEFAKDMMLVRAFRGIPEPQAPPMPRCKPAPKPPPRRATRPAGPAGSPAPAAPVDPPRRAAPVDEGHAGAPGVPEWAEPPARTATGQLVTEEDALADVARANRRAGVRKGKQKRR